MVVGGVALVIGRVLGGGLAIVVGRIKSRSNRRRNSSYSGISWSINISCRRSSSNVEGVG